MNMLKNTGPGIVVTAAFIGPGTVTVCLLSGTKFGYSLLWAMIFAVIATIVLQEMSARLGLVTGGGLSEAINRAWKRKWIKYLAAAMIVTGILMGNAAYEAGNISGTLIGIRMIFDLNAFPDFLLNLFVYVPVFLLLYFGTYKIIEKFFIAIVGLMSLSFIIAAIITKPDLTLLLAGFLPSIPNDSILSIVGLIGTTVVPYNLFLHAAMIKNKWNDPSSLPDVKKDTVVAITLGGIISACIIITGASMSGAAIENINDLAKPFDQVYGVVGRYLFGFGIFAAGFTSTITAPLAASLVAKGLFSWEEKQDSYKIKAVWIIILTIGFISASIGYKPIEIIRLAQFANGLLLPLIAAFLIYVVNREDMMGKYKNTSWQNIISCLVLVITIILGMKGIGLF
jgi:Mn2+/Fe2+ NRAMP family transporter